MDQARPSARWRWVPRRPAKPTSSKTGNLTVTGAAGLTINPANGQTSGSNTATLNLSGLTSFTYNQAGQKFDVTNTYGSGNTVQGNIAINLSNGTNNITASQIIFADSGRTSTSPFPTSTVTLGAANNFNTGFFQVGGYNLQGVTKFATGLTGTPTLTLRGTGGGSTSVGIVNIESNSAGNNATGLLDVTGGTIDAIATTTNLTLAGASSSPTTTGTINMTAGTLNTGTLNFGSFALTAASAQNPVLVGTMNQNGGTVLAGNVSFGGGIFTAVTGNTGNTANTATFTSTYNLGPSSGTVTAGLLSAQTLSLGTTTIRNTASRAILNFYSGTLENYDPALGQTGSAGAAGGSTTAQNMTISGLTGGGAAGTSTTLNLVLAATGTHNFLAESGFSITEASTALISGTGGLTANGAGTLNLNGTNTYTGGTTVSAGTVNANTNTALGSAASTVGVTLTPASGTAIVNFTSAAPVIASLSSSGAGVSSVVLGNTTTPSATTLTVGNSSNLSSTFAGVISDGSDTNAAAVGTGTNLTKAGTGTLTLSGANTYTGVTTIGAGTLVTANANALGTTGSIGFTGGNLQYGSGITTDYSARIANSTSAVSIDTNGNNVTYATALPSSNSGGLTKLGAGTLTLTAAELYTGTTTINRGTLDLGGSTATGSMSSSSPLAMGGGTLNYTATGGATQTFAGTTFNSGGSTITVAAGNTLNLGAITRNTGGTAYLNTTGTITTSTANGNGTTVNTGTNGFLGAYAVYGSYDWAASNGGTITYFGGYTTYDNVASFPTGADLTDSYNSGSDGYDGTATNSVTVNSVRFNTGSTSGDNNSDPTINVNGGNNLTISSGGILVTPNLGVKYAHIQGGGLTTGSSADLVIQQWNTGSGHLQISSSIFGEGGLTKAGPGQFDLQTDSPYTGVTTVNGGTMLVSGGITGTTNVTINNGGTLLLGANDRINDLATVTLNGGTLNTGGFQEGRATGTATATTGLGALTLSSSSILDFGSGHSGSSVLAFAASNTQTWSGTLTLADFTPGTDELNFASATGLTTTQLGEISLTGYTATGLDGFGDVTFSASSVPEPATWAAGFLMLGTLGYSQRRQVRRWLGATRPVCTA